MGFLGKPQGCFNLHDSDNFIGSYISDHDLAKILDVTLKDLSEIDFLNIYGGLYIDEHLAQMAWYKNKINNAPPHRINGGKCSLDELVLKKIVNNTYHDAIIEHQLIWGRKKIDFKITVHGVSKLIEFHGPYHFVKTKFGCPEYPFLRKQQAEDYFGIEYVIWPYWIPRCISNIRTIFEEDVSGIGAIWSANVHFSHFYFKNSAEIISIISSKFKAIRNDSYGYFYESGYRYNKPEHPIITEIKNGVATKDILLPKGFQNESAWLPSAIL